MTRRQILGWLALGSATFASAGCTTLFPNKFRFRMTVEVDTPQGLRSGSGVMEIAVSKAVKLTPEMKTLDIDFRGEAVAVDLPGGTLFALVGQTRAVEPFDGAVLDTFDPSHKLGEDLIAFVGEVGTRKSLGRSVEMRAQDLPKLVRFRDIRDPRSVELVDPNDLAKSFGPGVKLRRIVLTVVDEPVTVGIEKRLQAMNIEPNHGLDRTKVVIEHPTLAQQLSYGDFKKGTGNDI